MSAMATLETKPEVSPPRSFTPVARPVLQRKCACGGTIGPDGECENCKRNRQLLQRRAAEAAAPTTVPASVHRTLASPGRPLDGGTRGFMESRFGHDFSRVRVHTDGPAASSAREVGARAYTVGSNVVFGAGQYAPHTSEGRQLLAHELAHTVQQRGLQQAPTHVASEQSPEYRRLEREADSAADAVMSGNHVSLSRPASAPTLSKAPKTPTARSGSSNKWIDVDVNSSYFGKLTFSVKAEGGISDGSDVEESFQVDKIYVPYGKGKVGGDRFQELASEGVLMAVVDLSGSAFATQWQLRDSPSRLQATWLAARGLKRGAAADAAWATAGGGATFPECGAETCQIDHIVELQSIGGNNAENLQPLNPTENSDSGQALWNEVSGLARAIKANSKLSNNTALTQVRMKFNDAKLKATSTCSSLQPGVVSGTKGAKKGTNCVSIGRALTENAAAAPAPSGTAAPTSVWYALSARESIKGKDSGSQTEIEITALPTTKDEDIYSNRANRAAAQLISGLLLQTLKSGATKTAGTIDATIDTRSNSKAETRIPLSLEGEGGAGGKVPLAVGPQSQGGRLSLINPSPGLEFTYPFLSPGAITSIELTENGEANWTGYIDPQIKFLGRLDIAQRNGALSITKGLGLTDLKAPLPGVRIVESSLGLQISPEFRPTGRLGFEFGPATKPVATASFVATTDGKGLVATGQVKLNIPGIKQSNATVTYRGGGEYGAGNWDGELAFGVDDLPLPFVKTGSITARMGGTRPLTVSGSLGLELPGGSVATVSLSDETGDWVLSGVGTFKVPTIGDVQGSISYNTRTTEIVASIGEVPFTLFRCPAKLEKLTGRFVPGQNPVFTGAGSLRIKRGKLDGTIRIELGEDGRLSGTGRMAYPLFDGVTPEVTITYKNDRLRIEAAINIAEFVVFQGWEKKQNLLDSKIAIPIPGLSAGLAGVNAVIRLNLDAGFSLGRMVISPLVISAGLNPLDTNPDYEIGADGTASSTNRIWVTAAISGGVELALGKSVISVGAEFGLTLEGTAELVAILEAKLKARYRGGRFTADIAASLGADLNVTARLIAYVLAYAKFFGFEKQTRFDIELLKQTFPTGAHFKISAPFGYDSGAEQKVILPTMEQIVPEKPTFDPSVLMNDIMGKAKTTKTPPDAE